MERAIWKFDSSLFFAVKAVNRKYYFVLSGTYSRLNIKMPNFVQQFFVNKRTYRSDEASDLEVRQLDFFAFKAVVRQYYICTNLPQWNPFKGKV